MSERAEQRLKQAIDGLPRELQPERDLWPGIAYAIREKDLPRPRPYLQQMALAASLLVVLATSLYFGLRQPVLSPARAELAELIMDLQSQHQSSKNALLVQYRDQPAAWSDWQGQMQELEDAETAIYRALRQDPNNLELLTILRQVQDKQIKLIDAVFAPRLNAI